MPSKKELAAIVSRTWQAERARYGVFGTLEAAYSGRFGRGVPRDKWGVFYQHDTSFGSELFAGTTDECWAWIDERCGLAVLNALEEAEADGR